MRDISPIDCPTRRVSACMRLAAPFPSAYEIRQQEER